LVLQLLVYQRSTTMMYIVLMYSIYVQSRPFPTFLLVQWRNRSIHIYSYVQFSNTSIHVQQWLLFLFGAFICILHTWIWPCINTALCWWIIRFVLSPTNITDCICSVRPSKENTYTLNIFHNNHWTVHYILKTIYTYTS
jgi:hypothetical protein